MAFCTNKTRRSGVWVYAFCIVLAFCLWLVVPASATEIGTEPEFIVETEPEIIPETEPEWIPIPEPDYIPETEPDYIPEAEPEVIPEMESENVPEMEQETISETEPEIEPEEEQELLSLLSDTNRILMAILFTLVLGGASVMFKSLIWR